MWSKIRKLRKRRRRAEVDVEFAFGDDDDVLYELLSVMSADRFQREHERERG